MKKYFRMTALALMAALSLSLCACSKGKPDMKEKGSEAKTGSTTSAETMEPDTSEPVELTMYLLGDRTPDFDMVFEKINAKMSEKINTKLNVKFMSWAEYEQKYPLVFASGEDWDIIYSASWAFYTTQATKKGFWEITKENLEKYAPLTAKSIYPEAWQQSKIEGKSYMLPMNYKELTSYAYILRGDLMDKYGIKKVESMDDIAAYLDAVAKNEKGLIPLDVGSDFDSNFVFTRFWSLLTHDKVEEIGPWQLMTCVDTNNGDKVQSIVDRPEFLETVKKLKDWKDRGFWSKSAPVNTRNNKESFMAGKSASTLINSNTAKSIYHNIATEHPEWDIRIVDGQFEAPTVINSYLANGMSIFSKSKHPERALMALDLLRNDEEIHNLFSYGVEGVHWKPVGEKKLESLPEAEKYPLDGNCNWGIRNGEIWRTLQNEIPGFEELSKKWESNAKLSKYATFNFNNEAVKNEVAAVTEILGTDYKLLALGFSENPEADVEKLQKKLKAAGIDRICEEMERQAKVFLKEAK